MAYNVLQIGLVFRRKKDKIETNGKNKMYYIRQGSTK